MTTIELEAPHAAVLSVQMETYAQSYLDARKRAGHAWLDMGRLLSEARAEAKHGEWKIFLEATNTSEDWAKRLIAIYAQSLQDRLFADAMRTNFLSVATGYELISAPPEVRDRLLTGDTPPTQRQIRDEKQSAKSAAPPTLNVPPFWQCVDAHHPTAHLWRRERPDLLRSACGMVIQNRVPTGSADGGHCSSCVRATWPQNQGAINRPDGSPLGAPITPAEITDEERRIAATAGYVWEGSDLLPGKQAVYHFKSTGGVIDGATMTRPQFDAWLKIHTPPPVRYQQLPPPIALPIPTGDVAADDAALIASIRELAEPLDLQMIWEDGKVLLYWRGEEEDIEQMDLLSYGAALEWLKWEAKGIKQDMLPLADADPAPADAAEHQSESAIQRAKEARDAGRLERARSLIIAGEHAAARVVLDQIEVSIWQRDKLLATIPAGRRITLDLTPHDCAALRKEAKLFEQSGLTKKLPAISQTLVLLIEAINGVVK